MLDDLRDLYNTQRPHRAHHPRHTPEQAYLARPKATPPPPAPNTSASATTPSTNSAN